MRDRVRQGQAAPRILRARARLLQLAAAFFLLGCNMNSPVDGQASDKGARDAAQILLLRSRWAQVRFRIDRPFLGAQADEVFRAKELSHLSFRLRLPGAEPSPLPPDDDPNAVVVQLEMNSPEWITHQLDPGFPNHFQIYFKSGERRYGLEYRPSGQIELDGGFLLVGLDRKYPVMIECFQRPGSLPTQCQLWQRRQRGFTLSIYFNGSRLSEWEAILGQVEAFVTERVVSIEPPAEAANAL